jgi:hypothetical protein
MLANNRWVWLAHGKTLLLALAHKGLKPPMQQCQLLEGLN